MGLIKKFHRLHSPPRPFSGEIEQQFLLDYSKKNAMRRKILSVIALSICLGYFLFDVFYALYDETFRQIFFQKIALLRILGTSAIGFCSWLLFHPAINLNERYANICIAGGIVAIYIMLLALTCAAPFPDEYYYYYDGMLLTLLYLFGLTKLLAKPVLLLTILLLIFSALTFNAYALGITSVELATNHYSEQSSPIVFMSIFCIIGYLMTLEQERTARNTFLRETDLYRAREATNTNAAALVAFKEQSRWQAEQQNQDKSRFMANAAHDLRNVMQPVENFLDVSWSALSRGDTPQALEYLNDAIMANKALCSAVNAMLDISGLESGIIRLQLSRFDVRIMLAEIMQENRFRAEQQNVKLLLSKHQPKQAIVYSDRQHLKRIITNLLVNAIKYADSRKGNTASVAIAIIHHGKHIRLDVIDNGIGIALAEQENIFKPLYQLNNPERNRDNGIGLGLSIVTATLKLLSEHSLKLTSKPGIGTRFSLKLPASETLTYEDHAPLTHNASVDLSDLYVLLVENDRLVQRSMVALLQANHAQYEAVSSVAELQRLLPTLARDPDIVVTDYRLADNCTAVDVIRAVKTAFGKDLPTLILTGETTDLSVTVTGRKILHKPIAAKQLLTEIQQLAHGQASI